MKRDQPVEMGFVVNPISGMGGRVGLKGTDGVLTEAIKKGAKPESPTKAVAFLKAFKSKLTSRSIPSPAWLTCSNAMGESEFLEAGYTQEDFDIALRVPERTTAEHTMQAAEQFLRREVGVIVFCGGDGTARDLASVIRNHVPIVGIPAGVKMHSAVFGTHPESVADLLALHLESPLQKVPAEILDLDEERYRQGVWQIRLYDSALTLREPNLMQAGKMMFQEVSDNDIKAEIASYFKELMEEEPDTIFILGPGSTLEHIKRKMGIKGTLLGVDAVGGGELLARDCDEATLLNLLKSGGKAKIVVSPIGAQGFILGRGNLQISAEVIKKIGIDNLIIVATPSKLNHTPALRVDTGDSTLDEILTNRGHLLTVVGYRTMKLHPIQT